MRKFTLEESIPDNEYQEENWSFAKRQEEILELSHQMKEFGVSLTDVADSSQNRFALKSCQKVALMRKIMKRLCKNFENKKALYFGELEFLEKRLNDISMW